MMAITRSGGIPILMYHYLGDAPDTDDIPYYVSQSNFHKQMWFLKFSGYHAVSISQLVNAIQYKQRITKRSVVITFDDGHESFAEIGMPILEEFGFTATMFIITNKIDKPGYLTSKCIRALQGKGIHFESHSHTHPIITTLSDTEAEFEISESKLILESVLNSPVRFFAYRGGHYNDNVKKILQDTGYIAATCSKPGLNTASSDLYALHRMGIRGNDDLGTFAQKLLGNTAYPKSAAYLRHLFRI